MNLFQNKIFALERGVLKPELSPREGRVETTNFLNLKLRAGSRNARAERRKGEGDTESRADLPLSKEPIEPLRPDTEYATAWWSHIPHG